MIYEITKDCRINGQQFKKGTTVSEKEIGGYFPTVMKPTNKKENKSESPKEEIIEEKTEVVSEGESEKEEKKYEDEEIITSVRKTRRRK